MIKAIALGKFMRYSSRRSIIPNPFVLARTDPSLEFPRLCVVYVLQFLSAMVRKEHHNELGYVGRSTVIAVLEDLGIARDDAEKIIQKMAEAEVIKESPDRNSDRTAAKIRVSGLGNYVIRLLLGKPEYLAMVMLDTPLAGSEEFKEISNIYKEHLTVLKERRDAAVGAFLRELQAHEQQEWERAQTCRASSAMSRVVPNMREQVTEEAGPSLFRRGS